MNEKLDAAYRNTMYCVALSAESTFEFRIGELSAALDELLARHNASTYAYITACNPGSLPLPSKVNKRRHKDFHDYAKAMRWACYEGEGRSRQGSWAAEKSLLIVGISKELALRLGGYLDQNAVVLGTVGNVPELHWCGKRGTTCQQPDDLVVGVDHNDGLVLISRDDAEALAEKWSAVRRAKTWGELRELCPDAYAELSQMEADRDDLEQIMTPDDSEPFDADQINAICDGNWQEWPASDMLDWLADDLCEELGEIQDSAYNGSYLYLPADQYAEIIAALETRGYRCVPDQVLIDRAHGG